MKKPTSSVKHKTLDTAVPLTFPFLLIREAKIERPHTKI